MMDQINYPGAEEDGADVEKHDDQFSIVAQGHEFALHGGSTELALVKNQDFADNVEGYIAELLLSACYDFIDNCCAFVSKHVSVMQKVRVHAFIVLSEVL